MLNVTHGEYLTLPQGKILFGWCEMPPAKAVKEVKDFPTWTIKNNTVIENPTLFGYCVGPRTGSKSILQI